MSRFVRITSPDGDYMEGRTLYKTCNPNRPGGMIITERALSFCKFPAGAKILDIGCGSGSTVTYLRESHNLDAVGIDIEVYGKHSYVIKAHAEQLPFPDASMDGVLMECSLSLMSNQPLVLNQCTRVLNSSGKLIVSDMYARGEAAKPDGRLGRIDKAETLVALIEASGYKVEFFEDFTHHLKTMWGQRIMNEGAQSFYCSLGVTPERLKSIKCGYCLIVASKKR